MIASIERFFHLKGAMDYILEITKIIDGALRSDVAKVRAYSEQLSRKLESSGDAKAARRIRECFDQSGKLVAANDLAPPLPMPVDSESRLHLADEVPPSANPPFIALAKSNHAEVERFLQYVEASDRLIAAGVGVSPSMLIYGPPGCGKTKLAMHIASRLELPLLLARSDSLISSYLGSTAKNIRLLFEHAMKRPCVLFLDEFDAIAKIRDDQHELGELKRVVVSLLQNIDAMDGRTILLAATNHEHLLDPAVWRRFSYVMPMSAPSANGREQLFRAFLREYADADDADLLATASDTLNGAQIQRLCDDSIRDAVLTSNSKIDRIKMLMRIAQLRIKDQISEDEAMAKAIHALDQHVFSGKRVASMFNVSPATMSRWLRG